MKQSLKYKLPRLTEEEFDYFIKHEKDFAEKMHTKGAKFLRKRLGMALQNLAVNKLIGLDGYEIDRPRAVLHHLNACDYYPPIEKYLVFRRLTGLVIDRQSSQDSKMISIKKLIYEKTELM